MGLTLLRKGKFAEAESTLPAPSRRLTFRNPNPCDGEPFYNLGLARMYQGKTRRPTMLFTSRSGIMHGRARAIMPWRRSAPGRGELPLALEQVELSLRTNCEKSEGARPEGLVAAPSGPGRRSAGGDRGFSCAGPARFPHDGRALPFAAKQRGLPRAISTRSKETFRRCSTWATTWPGRACRTMHSFCCKLAAGRKLGASDALVHAVVAGRIAWQRNGRASLNFSRQRRPPRAIVSPPASRR